jgi:uncharacterized protein (TIGR03435 family)
MKRIVAGVGAAVLASCGLFGQTAASALPRFEMASVKPSDPGPLATDTAQSWGDVTGRVTLRHILLKYVLLRVYDLLPSQLSGPEWLDTELFDILAIAPDGVPKEQIPLMFQALLAERFKLRFHWESQVAPVYALVVGARGPRLKGSLPDDASGTPNANVKGSGENTPISGMFTLRTGRSRLRFKVTAADGVLHFEFPSITMAELAEYLSGNIDLPVVDMTGLKGSYQAPLDIEIPGANRGLPPEPDDAGQPVPRASDPSVFSVRASLEKLGLRLERRRVPTEKFVIDHIEKTPTED